MTPKKKAMKWVKKFYNENKEVIQVIALMYIMIIGTRVFIIGMNAAHGG